MEFTFISILELAFFAELSFLKESSSQWYNKYRKDFTITMNKFATFFRESMVARFFIPAGILLIVFGALLFVVGNNIKNYLPATATVTSSELAGLGYNDYDGTYHEPMYRTFVTYTTAEGTEYTVDYGETYGYEIGHQLAIVYNPDDPTQISSPPSIVLNICLIVAGVASLIGGIISGVHAIQRHRKMKKQEEEWAKNGK